MRTRTGRSTALALAAAGLLLGAGTAWAVNIEIGNASIPPMGSGGVTVTLDPQGDGVVATLNDIQFPDGLEVSVTEQVVSATLASDITDTATEIPLEEGDADTLPSFGIVQIDDEEISYSSIAGDTLIVAARGETPAAHTAGAAVTVPTRVPMCSATAQLTNLNKEAVFSYIPDGCTPGTDCEGVRAIVIALDNLDEITSPTSLYTCTVETDQDEGTHTLGCPEEDSAEDPFQPAQSGDSPLVNGEGNLPTTCSDGTVTIGAACVGDCGGDGEVGLGEVQISFNIFLGTANLDTCPAADGPPQNGEVSLGEVQTAFNNFLNGCPQ